MSDYKNVIISSMQQRQIDSWAKKKEKPKKIRRVFIYAAAVISLAAGSALISNSPEAVDVMSHIETGFEYDETLGRLQYVSNILPQSAMVFLSKSGEEVLFATPTASQLQHNWNPGEPWMKYVGKSDVFACNGGEVAAIVKNRNDEYTVRMIHEDGYESVYSGLTSVFVHESDILLSEDCIGHSERETAFELRKDGMSIMPVFQKE